MVSIFGRFFQHLRCKTGYIMVPANIIRSKYFPLKKEKMSLAILVSNGGKIYDPNNDREVGEIKLNIREEYLVKNNVDLSNGFLIVLPRKQVKKQIFI